MKIGIFRGTQFFTSNNSVQFFHNNRFVFSKQRRSLGLELLLARVYRALRQLHREVYIWDVLILIDGGVFGAG